MVVVPPALWVIVVVRCLRTTNTAPLGELNASGLTGGSGEPAGSGVHGHVPRKEYCQALWAAPGTSSQPFKRTCMASISRALFSGKCIKARKEKYRCVFPSNLVSKPTLGRAVCRSTFAVSTSRARTALSFRGDVLCTKGPGVARLERANVFMASTAA